jgi:hypothetical protein
MDLTEFWRLIDSGVDDPQVVIDRIRAFSEQDLVDFWWLYQDLIDEVTEPEYTQNFSGHAVSEDAITDVAAWAVQQGQAYYEDVRDHPSKFPGAVPENTRPSYRGEAIEVYDDRYDDMIRDPDDPPPANA